MYRSYISYVYIFSLETENICVKHTDPTTTGMSNLKYKELFGLEIRPISNNNTLRSSDKRKKHTNGDIV